ncbi:helix-turn-helix transcriptional regulator [Metabacillus halosaccharovorans]|uniref:Helix-turn-helix transcriptional regulator n=1 Tax=Metabacillus halosaccharovorans TaxID=930124 RepID=A0ABT3DCE9_9BACI|nr:helix-turn-helix transcriptional regulator [Metabacillus halosaccharovorans]MCV9884734.1 helix-turn-helix transcriptional regulator [Metabacillus halosaccharovorans]
MTSDFMNVKFTLKQARLLKGYSQNQMAEELGIHVQTYRKMEKQPDTVTVGEAKKISEILGMNYDHIFFSSHSTLSRTFAGAVTT